MYEERSFRERVEQWVKAQPSCPNRKEAAQVFPQVPQKIIRAAIQSRKDREREAE